MADDQLDAILARRLAEGAPANVALMHLLAEAATAAEAEAAIARGAGRTTDPAAAERLAAMGRLLAAGPDASARIRAVLREAVHDRPAVDGLGHWTAVFDRLARTAPEEAVALYALGSPELLAATAAEVVALLRGWDLLGPDRRLLEIGCGIGRLTIPLSAEVGTALGLDVSEGMIAAARRRAEGSGNVSFDRSSGRDLAGVGSAGVDVVLAADVFPYLLAAGADLARTHVREAARVLRPGGALVILNYSYRGDDALDGRDVADHFAAAGLVGGGHATRPLALWDATAFLGRKPAGEVA